MELTNKRVNYNFSTTKSGLEFKGEVSIKDSLISTCNGQVYDNEGVYCGNFNYAETAEKANKSVNDVAPANILNIDNLIDDVITELKTTISEL